jgi:hypothetical protein
MALPDGKRTGRRRAQASYCKRKWKGEAVSNSVPFDTLKFVERLEAGGFTHAQAKAAAEAFAEATSQELATKADIAVVRADLREAELRLDAKIETIARDLKIWFGSIMVVAVGVILAAIRYLPAGGQ